MMALTEVAQLTGGHFVGADRFCSGVSIDTRRLKKAELFVAIRGQRRDGHGFVGAALEKGAAGALVSHPGARPQHEINVADTTAALARLGAGWRRRFTLPLVGVTGSNGKSTVVAMLASILNQDAACLSPEGNFNNQLGVPLTLLRLTAHHRHAVIEMGMDRRGEIAALSRLAQPAVALINNAAAAHLERLGSVAEVAKAKAEILCGLPPDGAVVLNADDAFIDYWRRCAAGHRVLTFGLDAAADVRAEDVQPESDRTRYTLCYRGQVTSAVVPLPGRHNLLNALAASAVCLALHIPRQQISRGLLQVQAVRGRLNFHRLAATARLIDDSYNANPDSMAAAIAVLATMPMRKCLVLGCMAELGADAECRHRDIGRLARQQGVDAVYVLCEPHEIGLASAYLQEFDANLTPFTAILPLQKALEKEIQAGACLLVKGSRAAAMERVVAALVPATGGDRC